MRWIQYNIEFSVSTLPIFLCRLHCRHFRHRNVVDVEPISSVHRHQCRFFFAVNIVDIVDIAMSTMLNQYSIYILRLHCQYFFAFNIVDIAMLTMLNQYQVYITSISFTFTSSTISFWFCFFFYTNKMKCNGTMSTRFWSTLRYWNVNMILRVCCKVIFDNYANMISTQCRLDVGQHFNVEIIDKTLCTCSIGEIKTQKE